MFESLKNFHRRDLFRRGGLLGLGSLFPGFRFSAAAAPPAAGLQLGPKIYESIGVRPLINCRGTLTIIGGSIELPEVRAAKDQANQQHVQIDELMDAAGKRLAELTGAEWGMVSAGCAAALSHATAACVAGGNPDLHVRIPNLAGFPKDEVIIPTHSRNVYDAAIRAVGVKIVEVDNREQLEAAIGPRTAMIYIFANQRSETGPPSFDEVTRIAREKNIPVLVDAAAEILTVPSVYLQRGATLVGYSGGKCIRGPQSAGVLLGRKDLVKAAWVHSAPHHGYSRAMKIGREEVVGMLMAIEMWVKRNHEAEWTQWISRLNHIAGRVSKINGVTTSIREPEGRSNRSPSLNIRWDASKLNITGQEVSNILYTTEPRIALGGGGGGGGGRRGQPSAGSETGISITAYMMMAGDEKIVAARIHQVLSTKHAAKTVPPPQPPAANLSGRWDVQIEYTASRTTHTFHLTQDGARVEGTHQGDFVSRELSGNVNGDTATFSSVQTERYGDSLSFRFSGKLSGNTISGDLDMGEYLTAKWTATRHQYRRG
ncbi:MAG: aminotransferase class V-fold PLP-dependent enzyme [Bryobacteraceae bacterium]